MQRKLGLPGLGLLVALLTGCSTAPVPLAPAVPGSPLADTIEFFPSDAFLRGFLVSPTRIASRIPRSEFGLLPPLAPGGDKPFWRLAQWFCVRRLSSRDRAQAEVGAGLWRNEFAALRVARTATGKAEVHLSIDSLSIFRVRPEAYQLLRRRRPHLLITHDFFPQDETVSFATADGRRDHSVVPDLADLASLVFTATVQFTQLEDCRDSYDGDVSANHHPQVNKTVVCAHFVAYNRDRASEGYGRSMWIAVPMLNTARLGRGYPRDVLVQDGKGTPAFFPANERVYGPAASASLAALATGETVRIGVDVLKLVAAALAMVQAQRPAVFPDSGADLAGFTLSHFNLGWESSGPYRGALRVGDLSLLATRER